MLPTWGPFPCVRTTSWPSFRRSARRALVSSIRRRWATASPPPGGRSALPPMATTSFVTRRPPAEGPYYFDQSIRRFGRGSEPRERSFQGSGMPIYQAPASPRPVTREELLVSLRTWFQKFRATVWFRITYLVLLGVIVAELYILTLSPLACLVILLMPVSTFVVPYWLGERKLRRFAENLVVVFLIAIVLAAAMSTGALLAQKDAVPVQSFTDLSTSPMALTNGTVSPYRAPPGTSFLFQVKLTTAASNTPNNYRVFLNLTVVRGINDFDRRPFPMTYLGANASSNNTKTGSWFVVNQTLGDSIYGYAFSATDRRSNWTYAGPDLGPVTASGWTFYGFFLYVTRLSQVTILPLLTHFAILLLRWYTPRQPDARVKAMARSAERSKEPSKDDSKERPKPALTV